MFSVPNTDEKPRDHLLSIAQPNIERHRTQLSQYENPPADLEDPEISKEYHKCPTKVNQVEKLDHPKKTPPSSHLGHYRLLTSALASPFEPQTPGLLITQGSINGKSCRFLIDNGSEICYISEHFCKKSGISTKKTNHVATMANGSTNHLKETLEAGVELNLGPIVEQRRFAVCPLNGYDAILGKNWLGQYNPYINHRTNDIFIRDRGKEVILKAFYERHPQIVPLNSILKDIRRK